MASKLPKCPLCGATVKVESVIWGMVKCSKCFYLVTGQIHRALAARGKVVAKGMWNPASKMVCKYYYTDQCGSCNMLGRCRRVVVSEEVKP